MGIGDWGLGIVPVDADEMWSGTSGRTLVEVMTQSSADILTAANYRIWPGSLREPQPQPHPSVAFRPMTGARLTKGNHAVSRPGSVVHGDLVIHEYQYRSFEQMRMKVRHGRDAVVAAGWPASEGSHWQQLGAMNDDDLMAEWLRMSTDPALVPC